MGTNRLTILAVCLAVGLGSVAEPTLAKKKNKNRGATAELTSDYTHPSGMGYPNGRPWQALAHDFAEVNDRLDVLDGKVDEVKGDTETIIDRLDDLQTDVDDMQLDLDNIGSDVAEIKDGLGVVAGDVDDIEDDVNMLKNTLSVEVRLGPATAAGITLFVQVAQNGMGVGNLDEDAFAYNNAFPAGAASYCGAACFTEGSGGVYMIDLLVDGGPGSYAGSLSVFMEIPDGDGGVDAANGTALVEFGVAETPVPN